MTESPTVADAMLHHPTLHRARLTVAEARAAFEASKKTRLLLLAQDGLLISTVTRDDLDGDLHGSAPAALLGSLVDRTVAPKAPLDLVREAMLTQQRRRIAVVDSSRRLHGLLCLKRNLTGFCTDAGVAAMRAERCSA